MSWTVVIILAWVVAAAVVGIAIGVLLRRAGEEPIDHQLLEEGLLRDGEQRSERSVRDE